MTGLQLLFSNQDVLPGKKGVKTVLFDFLSQDKYFLPEKNIVYVVGSDGLP
jgi:hypothetical protein